MTEAQEPLPEGLRRALAAFDDYLRVEKGASPRTRDGYHRDVRRYLRFLAERGVRTVREVRPADVADALGERAERAAAASTLARYLAAIRHFHRLCLREGQAEANPASLVDGPARGLSLPKALHEQDVTRIIDAAAATDPRGLRDRAMLEVLYAAGLRVSELVGIDLDDVDLEARAVRCVGKGDRERVVPIGRAAARALAAYLRDGRPALVRRARPSAVFVSGRGARLSRQTAWKIVKRYATLALPGHDVFPHAFRHSFATHLVGRGADIRVVQEALGHARLSTTQVYTLVSREKLKDVYEAAHPRGRRNRGPRAAG